VLRIPRPVYELVGLLGKHSDGHFYREELTPVIVTKNRTYPSLKCCAKGPKEQYQYLVRWAGYTSDIRYSCEKTWPPATNPPISTSLY
jgi:hypothetical protein